MRYFLYENATQNRNNAVANQSPENHSYNSRSDPTVLHYNNSRLTAIRRYNSRNDPTVLRGWLLAPPAHRLDKPHHLALLPTASVRQHCRIRAIGGAFQALLQALFLFDLDPTTHDFVPDGGELFVQ